MNEETLNKFLIGATVEQVMLYPEAIHIRLDSGAILVAKANGDYIHIDILGPDKPPPFSDEPERTVEAFARGWDTPEEDAAWADL